MKLEHIKGGKMIPNVIATALIASTLVISVGSAIALEKKTTVQGKLETTISGICIITGPGDKEYYFDPSSKAGKMIWAVCDRDKTCIVTGDLKKNKIISVTSVAKGA